MYKCPICESTAYLHDVVDFNKNCLEVRNYFLPKLGMPIYYCLCSNCEFLFAPEFSNWDKKDFTEKIYNSDYIEIDPDYIEARPNSNYKLLNNIFPNFPKTANHLDFGGGNGALSQLLSSNQWKSSSYDPFDSHNSSEIELIKYDLITAFEVFEHAVNPNSIFNNITNFASEESLIFISTLLNDGNIAPNKRLEWWYASPRNGHISLFSSLSLKILAEKFGFNFASLGVGYHIFYKKLPLWTNTLIQTC